MNSSLSHPALGYYRDYLRQEEEELTMLAQCKFPLQELVSNLQLAALERAINSKRDILKQIISKIENRN